MPTLERPKILIIEDDPDAQDVISEFFKHKNYQIISYSCADTVILDLQQKNLHADIIISDLNLPRMSGMELTHKIRELGLHIPIILITANKNVEIAAEAIRSGAYDFVVKPIHFPQLLVSVERALYLQKIKTENVTLKAVVEDRYFKPSDRVVFKSIGFKKVYDTAVRVSNSMANILITGESGTGKEVIAKTIHLHSRRREHPFIAINCSAIPESLMEAELFGHVKGAFTGALDRRLGLFEEADGGTLFLDEIGDLDVHLQAKLLRVIQERKIKRIGENHFRDVNVRIIAATFKDIKEEVRIGNFRKDLFYRLNVIPLHIPPLRERKEDILPLAEFFLKKFVILNQLKQKKFSRDAVEKLNAQPWFGNVRELENAIERAVVLSEGHVISGEDLPDTEVFHDTNHPTFEFLNAGKVLTINDVVANYVKQVLAKNGGAKEKTSRELGIDRKTLYRKIQDIERGLN